MSDKVMKSFEVGRMNPYQFRCVQGSPLLMHPVEKGHVFGQTWYNLLVQKNHHLVHF